MPTVYTQNIYSLFMGRTSGVGEEEEKRSLRVGRECSVFEEERPHVHTLVHTHTKRWEALTVQPPAAWARGTAGNCSGRRSACGLQKQRQSA